MSLQVPVPDTFLAAVWIGIGLTFGRGFGKNLDQIIQKTNCYKTLTPQQQWLIARTLDVARSMVEGRFINGLYCTPTREVIDMEMPQKGTRVIESEKTECDSKS